MSVDITVKSVKTIRLNIKIKRNSVKITRMSVKITRMAPKPHACCENHTHACDIAAEPNLDFFGNITLILVGSF
jgi:hypothetical protein